MQASTNAGRCRNSRHQHQHLLLQQHHQHLHLRGGARHPGCSSSQQQQQPALRTGCCCAALGPSSSGRNHHQHHHTVTSSRSSSTQQRQLVALTEPLSTLDVDKELWEVLDLCSDAELEALYNILHASSPFSPVVKSLVREEEPPLLQLRGRTSIMHKVGVLRQWCRQLRGCWCMHA
jgi:hypothetical protein